MQGTISDHASADMPKPDPLGWDFEDIPTPKLACPPVRSLPRNTEGRDLIIGDIHGQRRTLERLLETVGYAPDRGDRVLLLGDVIDRGPDSPGMLPWLQRDGVHCIRGNHEDLMIAALGGDKDMEELWVRKNGGEWAEALDSDQRDQWREALDSLPIALEVDGAQGTYVLVHAEISETTPWWATKAWIERGNRDALIRAIWAKWRVGNPFRNDTGVPDVWRTFHGHVALKDFVQVGNMRWIDRGAGHAAEYALAGLACVAIGPDGWEQEPALVRVRDVEDCYG